MNDKFERAFNFVDKEYGEIMEFRGKIPNIYDYQQELKRAYAHISKIENHLNKKTNAIMKTLESFYLISRRSNAAGVSDGG